MFPRARIPYGTWGSSYFPAWQTSALAEVNIGQFAGEAAGMVEWAVTAFLDGIFGVVLGMVLIPIVTRVLSPLAAMVMRKKKTAH